ncbi:MAG TPA: ATP-binding protein [Verrucomicrobiota bacterium]|nr:ATP-binding protein [Verrucomicrobiota bacterium]
MSAALQQNAYDLEQELVWFARVLDARFKLYFGQETEVRDVIDLKPPELRESSSAYAQFVRHYQMSFGERVAMALGLTPHLRPQLLDVFHTKNSLFDRRFTEFGGVRDANGDFVPTGETLAFILAANDLERRFALTTLFERDHFFARHNILRLLPAGDEPLLKAPLGLSEEHLSLLTLGHTRRPDFGPNFPARFIGTQLAWDDLVLHPATRKQVGEIEVWLRHGETLMTEWGMGAKLRPGCRVLFYGPPGTGKTMTACLLGKSTGRDVYKVDLSLVVSKYIGETEKNLARVFDQAEHKNWILFFDEADSLFGKRSETKDAHDRYANQEVSFLLQRIETFDGISILASNQRENLDPAFARRFEAIIYFPIPRPEERQQLWRRGFSTRAQLDPDVDPARLARDHELAGGAIMNVVRYASLQALEAGGNRISAELIHEGIRREYAKEGRNG